MYLTSPPTNLITGCTIGNIITDTTFNQVETSYHPMETYPYGSEILESGLDTEMVDYLGFGNNGLKVAKAQGLEEIYGRVEVLEKKIEAVVRKRGENSEEMEYTEQKIGRIEGMIKALVVDLGERKDRENFLVELRGGEREGGLMMDGFGR
jgi:hypothetical protein